MFDWLKEILGDSYTEEIDKKVAAEIGKGFVSKSDFNTKNEAVKTLTETLAARDGQLEALKDVDAAGMKAEIERLQGENKTAKETHEKALSKLQFDFALDKALGAAKVKNTKAARALLDVDALKLDGETLLGFDGQLAKIKETDAYLFDSDKPAPQIIGSTPGAPAADMSAANLRSIMGLPAKSE